MSAPMSAGDVCTRSVVIVATDTPVADAAALMRTHHVGCLVAVRETPAGNVPVGIVTDRDIVTAVVARQVDLHALQVGDLMSDHLAAMDEDESVLDALRLMRSRGVRRVVVTGREGTLVGLVALDDVLDLVSELMQSIVACVGNEQGRERVQRP